MFFPKKGRECSVCGLPVYSHVIESTWNRDCLVEQRACRVDCCRLCTYDAYALCVTLPWWQSNTEVQAYQKFPKLPSLPGHEMTCCSAVQLTIFHTQAKLIYL